VFIKYTDALSATEFPHSHSLVRTAWNKMLIIWRKGNTENPGSMPWQSTCYICMLPATHESLLIKQHSYMYKHTVYKTSDLYFFINQWVHEQSMSMIHYEYVQYIHIIELHMAIIWCCQKELWIRGKTQRPDRHCVTCNTRGFLLWYAVYWRVLSLAQDRASVCWSGDRDQLYQLGPAEYVTPEDEDKNLVSEMFVF
jgi:hypothetical protein